MVKNIQNANINRAVDLLLEGDVDLSNVLGKGGVVKELTKAILERALAAEMDDHLGYDRYGRSQVDNARNGSYNKNLITDNGVIELNVPRDREGEFIPAIVPKKQNTIYTFMQ